MFNLTLNTTYVHVHIASESPSTSFLSIWGIFSLIFNSSHLVNFSICIYWCIRTESPPVRLSACVFIAHKGRNNTIQVYSVIVLTHAIALDTRQSSQGIFESITPVH